MTNVKILSIWIAFCCFFLNACQSPPSSKQPVQFTGNIMTIDYHISIGGPLTLRQKELIQRIIKTTFEEINTIYNKWNPHSEISRLNALPAYVSCSLSPELFSFLQRVSFFVQITGGRFDPTIEPLQELWKEKLEKGKVPSKQEIEHLKPCLGWHTIHFDNGIFFKEDGRTQLDLGGIAKGFCVDLLTERLYHAGFKYLFVEWGGEIRTQGTHPTGRPWHIYISHPGNADPSLAIAHLELIDRALATSGDYFQYWKTKTEAGEEKIYCHIFNPLTLTPLEVKPGSIASASLLASNCFTADALAKVLMLFDTPSEAQHWLQELQEQHPELACWIATR